MIKSTVREKIVGSVEKLIDDWHINFKYSTDLQDYLEIFNILQ